MTNKEYFYQLKEFAFNSVYWSRYARGIYRCMTSYAPMIDDNVWLSVCDSKETIGVFELEKRLGRCLKLEELTAVPISVDFFLCGTPVITETEKELERLKEFEQMFINGYNKNENRTIGYEIKALRKKLD